MDFKNSWHLYAIIGLLAFSLYNTKRDGIAPDPQPKAKPVQSIVNDSIASLKTGYADALESTAKGIKEGKVKTGKDLFDDVSPLMKAAREKAFAEIDGLLQDQLPRDEKDQLKEEASAFIDNLGKAFRKAK